MNNETIKAQLAKLSAIAQIDPQIAIKGIVKLVKYTPIAGFDGITVDTGIIQNKLLMSRLIKRIKTHLHKYDFSVVALDSIIANILQHHNKEDYVVETFDGSIRPLAPKDVLNVIRIVHSFVK